MIVEILSGLQQTPDVLDPDAQAVIELVFDRAQTANDVTARARALMPGLDVTARTAFEGPEDRYIFLDFPTVSPRGNERTLFALARALRPALDATEAHPVLPDSIIGAVAVGAASPESFAAICETPRRDDLPFGWVHPVIRTPQAWQLTRGNGVTVAVIDTGYSTHFELQGAIRNSGQRNFIEGGTDALDRFSGGFLKHPGHGTVVCSVVASRGRADSNGDTSGPGAITGSAPEATILPIRAIKSVINFNQSTVPAAIAHAVRQGADVITFALGGPSRVAATERALRDAVAAGVVITSAAGNCWPWVVFPAAYAPEGLCCAVAALTPDLSPWAKSGRGPQVTIAAPGEQVWAAAKNKTTDPDAGIRPAQGTTLATSLTAGVAALWVAHHGGRAALKAHADAARTTVQAMFNRCATAGLVRPPGWNGAANLGAGVLDAEKTLKTPLPTGPTGTEAVADAQLPPQGTQTTLNVAVAALAAQMPEAAAELDGALADHAAEILWLSYRNAARERAVATGHAEALSAPPDTPTAALVSELAQRPALARATGPV
jgi:serine protease